MNAADVLLIVLVGWSLYLLTRIDNKLSPRSTKASPVKAEKFSGSAKVTPINVAVPDAGNFKMLEETSSNDYYPYGNYDTMPTQSNIQFSSDGRGWVGSPQVRRTLLNGADINDFLGD